MAVPKGILKSTQDLRESMSLYNKSNNDKDVPRHVNFDSRVTEENFTSVETIESLGSTAFAPEAKFHLADIEKQPEHVAKVLKKFLRGDWELDLDGDDFLFDKILLEFPVFALNNDYIRALANIVFMKVDSV